MNGIPSLVDVFVSRFVLDWRMKDGDANLSRFPIDCTTKTMMKDDDER